MLGMKLVENKLARYSKAKLVLCAPQQSPEAPDRWTMETRKHKRVLTRKHRIKSAMTISPEKGGGTGE